MNFFESANLLGKKLRIVGHCYISGMGRKELAHLLFLILLCLFYVIGNGFGFSNSKLRETTVAMENYGERLKDNFKTDRFDSTIVDKEREHLLLAIEERIAKYLYQIPDYSYIATLETYLTYRPELLHQFPSCVPLEKGNYSLSSRYGMRTHPISKKTKTHFGIDLAAPSGKPIYASAAGTVSEVIYSENGYGIHIIIRHRFGFKTLYGHLEKVLVAKGQTIDQHELIATVGSSGSSTGFHLHYEVWKNEVKIDPRPSFNLKKTIYAEVMDIKPNTHGK
ncbi:M23 family peptidase [Flagellimonas aequoris]|uniref:M23 family metallopeptidase n=2 Tax=Flagellimonas aequoris TaxID=2306997 RepID=A0A418N5C7_9FLAO|nr:M23 family peptidase [Allomuricauda aequoris]TXK00668.1 M23 family metallopeptidase [Allomuricauda aequoris]